MRYRLLGRIEVIADDGRPVPLHGDRERILLAPLLGANRVVPAARLIDALWGDNAPVTAGNASQAQVSRLRKKLDSASNHRDILRGEPLGYRLDVKTGELDMDGFERLVGVEGDATAKEVSSRLGEALARWRGSAFADVYSHALGGEAARLDELRLLALERRVDADLASGRHLELVAELEALVHDQPLREGARRQLMIALYPSGRQADAPAAHRDARETLADELGIDPGPRLQALELAS